MSRTCIRHFATEPTQNPMLFSRGAAVGLLIAAAAFISASQHCPEPVHDRVVLLQGKVSVASSRGKRHRALEPHFTKLQAAEGMANGAEPDLTFAERIDRRAWWTHRPHRWLTWHTVFGTWAAAICGFLACQILSAMRGGQEEVATAGQCQRRSVSNWSCCKRGSQEQDGLTSILRHRMEDSGTAQAQERSDEDEVVEAASRLQGFWDEEAQRRQSLGDARLLRSLLRFVGCRQTLLLISLALASVVVNSTMMVLVVDNLLRYVEWLRSHNDGSLAPDPFWSIVLVVSLCSVLPIVGALLEGHLRMRDGHISCQISSALLGLVYRKAQHLSPAKAQDLSLNLLNDLTEMPKDAPRILLDGIVLPLNMIALLVLLWSKVGSASALVTFGFLPLLWVSGHFLGFIVPARVAYQVAREERMGLVHSALQAVLAVKASAWEKPLLQRLREARDAELRSIWTIQNVGQQIVTIGITWPRLVTFGVLLIHSLRSPFVDGLAVITCLQVLGFLACQISALSRCKAKWTAVAGSCARIQNFLKLPEIPISACGREGIDALGSESSLCIHGSFSLEANGDPVLLDVNVRLPKGACVALVGEAGAGKTLFLHAAMGKLYPSKNAVVQSLSSQMAYCHRAPWILEASLQENVCLHKSAVSEERFNAALQVAGLPSDLESCPSNDKNLIAEGSSRWAHLTSGERARIAVARALYNNEELILLDDPFGALNESGLAGICERLFKSTLLHGRTCIIATRPDVINLSSFTHVLLMAGGRVVEQRPPDQMLQCAAFQRVLRHRQDARCSVVRNKIGAGCTETMQSSSTCTTLGRQEASATSLWYYCKIAGWHRIIAFLTLLAVSQLTMLGMDLSLATLANDADETYPMRSGGPREGRVWLWLYSMFWFGAVCIGGLANIAGASSSRAFSKRIHEELSKTLLLSTFKSYCPEQAVEHFSTHLGQADFGLWVKISGLASVVLASVCPMAYVHAVLPLGFSAAVLPCYCALAIFIAASCRTSSMLRSKGSEERLRLETWVSESLQNAVSAHAIGQRDRLAWERTSVICRSAQANIMLHCIGVQRLLIRLATCFSIVFVLAGLAAVLYPDSLGQGSLGLVLVFCVLVSRNLEVGVEHCTGLQPDLAVVERLRSFCATPVEEPETSQATHDVSAGLLGEDNRAEWLEEPWLRQGPAVHIKSLYAGYSSGPDIIQGLSLELSAGHKLGIHGGPGTGKSSLLLSLLRLLEVREGSIFLNGVDIMKMGRRPLRMALGFVSQEPLLLQGTVRFNLDPLSQHTTEEMLVALRTVGLESLALDSQLHASSEGKSKHTISSLVLGSGERRLLTLARMILRQPALLLLDDVSGCPNIDPRTRDLVQKTITSCFPRSTMIAVSRRSDSLVGFDRLVELRGGGLVEAKSASNSLCGPPKSQSAVSCNNARLGATEHILVAGLVTEGG